MKKAKSPKRNSAAKGRHAPKNVDEYFARVPEPAHSALKKMRAAIRSASPAQASETISYQIPAFKHDGIVVWYAAFSDHCSLFPTAAVIEAFKSELKGFTTSKGTIQFPIDRPLPLALIKKIAKARLAQNESKRNKSEKRADGMRPGTIRQSRASSDKTGLRENTHENYLLHSLPD